MSDFAALVPLANRLADEAGVVARAHYRQPFDVDSKSDASPVTIADRTIEQKLRDILAQERPDDGILGEEFGPKDSTNGLTWVIDPIDGTKSFVIGRPTFGTLIALCFEDKPVLGIIDQPILNERWVGLEGAHTTFNGAPVQTRRCPALAQACAGSTTPAMFDGLPPVYETLEAQSKMMAWGGDCYLYGLIANGHADLAVEASLSPYDFAALAPVIKGAGGKICDWAGNPLTLKSDGCVVAMGDPALWPRVRDILSAK